MNNEKRKSSIMYQSFSFKMIQTLVQSKTTPAWIRIWLYLSILQKNNKVVYPKNNYISEKLDIPFGTVKFAISKLEKEGFIKIVNPKSWKRQIKLTHMANIDDEDYPDLKKKNESEYHKLFGRVPYKENVYLTENEFLSIQNRINNDSELEFYLTGLNSYLNNATIRYESHFKLLCTWIEKNENQTKMKKKKFETPDFKWFIDFERNYIPQTTEEEHTPLFDYDWLNNMEESDKD